MFTEFDQELRNFTQSTINLGNFLSKLPGFNNMQIAKTGTSAHDIVIASLSFKRAFNEAHQYQVLPRTISIIGSPIDWELAPDPQKYLEASTKALLFPIRSFQNNIYGVFLYLDGSSAGPYTSMSSCLEKSENNICKLIKKKLPKYRDWFLMMKQVRDRIKCGNSSSFGFKNKRFGIILNDFNGANSALKASLDQIISMDTFIEAFKWSTKISELALNYVNEHK